MSEDPVFLVKSEQFEGPIDLLLYLVRRHEVTLTGISLSKLTERYLDHLGILKEIKIDSVGDFIEVAALLVEMKSRQVLPKNEFETEVEERDPREDLVERLLLFKQFKDAALLIEDRKSQWADYYVRRSEDLLVEKIDPAKQPIADVELWDLVSAFGRVLKDNQPLPKENIIYDETPIQVYMKKIHGRLVDSGKVSFSELFEPGMHKSAMVGVFLAVLELTRHHNVEAKQEDLHSEIWMAPSDGFKSSIDVHQVDDYNPHAKNLKAGDPSSLIE